MREAVHSDTSGGGEGYHGTGVASGPPVACLRPCARTAGAYARATDALKGAIFMVAGQTSVVERTSKRLENI